jgi:endoglucanase
VVHGGIVMAGRPAGYRARVAARASRACAVSTEARRLTALTVRDNRIVDQDGAPVRLLGFNTSGAEFACIEGWGIFDGLRGDNTRMPAWVVGAMAGWTGANTVRVPLNQQCWLGLRVKRSYGGLAYQQAVHDYVRLLREHGFIVVLDLHRSAPGTARSLHQEQMPDRDHSVMFWSQVAGAYKDDLAVVFDLFNEPWPYNEVDSTRAWRCWRDGGCELISRNGGQHYTAAGMNELIAAIRATGARNVVAVGGIYWAEILTRWLEHQPSDPLDNVIASFHSYSYNQHCNDTECYDTVLAQVAAAVPLFVGEIGPDTVGVAGDEHCPPEAVRPTGSSERLLDWLDAHDASYTPWSWNAWGDCYSLISSYSGRPTPIWGTEVKDRLARHAK